MPLTNRLRHLRWDSSDPDRAPPPLPLNPGSPQVSTRPNTSAAIAATAQALHERAREGATPSAYTTNAMPETSPERSLIKGAQHRRLQSLQTLQTGSARDLKGYFDGVRSPDKSPERPLGRSATPTLDRDYLMSSPEKSPTRSGTPTPAGRDITKDTPILRPSTRPPPKAILGENTPPSATMLALQTMPVRDIDTPLGNITNSSVLRSPQNLDALSTQILGLTSIATSLQREMAQLNRRSKDNATDLVTLKEATNARDEDIRKTLKELVNNFHSSVSSAALLGPPGSGTTRSISNFGPPFSDSRGPGSSPPSARKSFSLPRISNPFLDERIGSPSPISYSIEGAASVAMLEKIVREMVTKEGQERLLSNLSQLLEKASQESGETAKKVEELVSFIKDGSQSQALVPHTGSNRDGPPKLELNFDGSQTSLLNGDGTKPLNSPKAADIVSDKVIELLKKLKESVTQSGGLMGEVKAQQRDLRGEILGLGRDLGRRIDEASQNGGLALTVQDGQDRQDLVRIVQEGLADVKEHLDRVMREQRRQSSSSVISRATVDNQEVYDVVKHALKEQGLDRAAASQANRLDKEEILSAVREAYEEFKPEIEVQQFGLERDEILQCLREGLEDYRSSSAAREANSISKDDVFEAIQVAMQNFHPPSPINEAHEIRDEVLGAVRECLEAYIPTIQQSSTRDIDVTKGIVLDAVKEGLTTHGPNAPRELEISREDLFEALKAALESSGTPFGSYGEKVVNQLHEIVQGMRTEFQQYSAANGRDTEQVLDAVKDDLESLRAEIEAYVDRAQDVTGKDEIIDTVRGGLENLRADVEQYVAIGPRGDNALSKSEMLAYIKSEFEHLHEAMRTQVVPAAATGDRQAILNALHDGFEELRSHVGSRSLDDDLPEDVQEALKVELEQLRETLLAGSASHKDEVLEALQSSLDGLHVKLNSDRGVSSSEEVLTVLREEFEHLRGALATTLIRSGGSADKEDIIDAVRESLDGLRTHLSADQNEASKEQLGAIQEELEHLRETLVTTLVRSGAAGDSEAILEALRVGLNEIRATSAQSQNGGINEEIVEAIRGELERLQQSIPSNLAHNSRADTEEVLDAVKLGLDDLRSHLEKKLDNPERHTSATNDILDALNDGLDNLRTDVAKMVDKPVDMTVSYEILDTLKDGLTSLRADIERLKSHKVEGVNRALSSNEVVLAEDPDAPLTREVPLAAVSVAPDALRRNDLEGLEVRLAQLHIKIEALDDNIQNMPASASAFSPRPAEGTAMKTDLAGIEDLLKDLQATVTIMAARELGSVDGVAKKEDTDAIETLLRNTKERFDEIVLPGSGVSKDQLDAIEDVARLTNDAVDGLITRVDEKIATKEDVTGVELLVHDLRAALEDIKDSKVKGKSSQADEPEEERTTKKKDLDILGTLCMEIKNKVAEMTFPDAETLPSKADIDQLTGLIHDFRDSHDKVKDGYEADVVVTAKAFDDRKREAEDIIVSIAGVKAFIEEFKEELKSRLDTSKSDLGKLTENVKGLDETIGGNIAVTADIKELMETVNREFERISGSFEDLKTDQDEKATVIVDKHDESRDMIIAELSQKLDERFEGMMAKCDDALIIAESQAKMMEDKAAQQEEILTSTKAMADDLNITIGTLGTSITAMNSTFNEATEKMGEDSMTVFDRIEETISKLDDNHAEARNEYQLTRGEIARAITAVDGLQSDVTEFHPKFMVTLREILALVNQHYEHSQKAQEQANAASEESKSHLKELKSSFSTLPALLPPPSTLSEPIDRYNDSQTQEKLDRLLGHATESGSSIEQLERLDQIQRQVIATAAEVSEFVASQTRTITDGHESRVREAEEVALLLERRLAQKEQIEAEIHALNDRKESLRAQVEGLASERDTLVTQKTRLTADVSSLETALHIRREELFEMDAKADALERRILEGIMDHSRVMLMAKSGKAPNSAKPKSQRAASTLSQRTISTLPPSNAASNGLALALKTRPAVRRNHGTSSNPASRRILSLNQITGNVPAGASAFQPGYVPAPTLALAGLKRSHSVKSQYMRKSSWNGVPSRRVSGALSSTLSGVDKENAGGGRLSDVSDNSEDLDDSEAGTERRQSYATATGTDSGMTYGSSSYGYATSEGITPSSDRRMSYGAGTRESDLSYGTGSYLTGSELDRRTSIGSTVRSTLGERTAERGESGEESGAEEESVSGERVEEATPRTGGGDGKSLIVFPPPSDSGLGTDMPSVRLSAALSGSETGYFRRAAEEKSAH